MKSLEENHKKMNVVLDEEYKKAVSVNVLKKLMYKNHNIQFK